MFSLEAHRFPSLGDLAIRKIDFLLRVDDPLEREEHTRALEMNHQNGAHASAELCSIGPNLLRWNRSTNHGFHDDGYWTKTADAWSSMAEYPTRNAILLSSMYQYNGARHLPRLSAIYFIVPWTQPYVSPIVRPSTFVGSEYSTVTNDSAA